MSESVSSNTFDEKKGVAGASMRHNLFTVGQGLRPGEGMAWALGTTDGDAAYWVLMKCQTNTTHYTPKYTKQNECRRAPDIATAIREKYRRNHGDNIQPQ